MTDLQKLSDTMREWSDTAGDHHWQAHLAIQELIRIKAQVEQFRDALQAVLVNSPNPLNKALIANIELVLESSPSQCLADVKVMAGRDGFIAGLFSEIHNPTTVWNREERAEYYANQLRQAVKAQVEQLREDPLVAFGDGFYEGYLHYAKLCGDLDFTDDAMRQSELAEADSVYGKQVGSSVRAAEIKAQAGRDGFIAGLFSEIHNPTTVWNREERADSYANQLRQAAKGE